MMFSIVCAHVTAGVIGRCRTDAVGSRLAMVLVTAEKEGEMGRWEGSM